MNPNPNHLAEQATNASQAAADSLVNSTQRIVGDTQKLARRGIEALRYGSEHLRDRALQATDSTAAYIKDEPVKSMLMAAAAGAALVVLGSLLTRSRD